MGYNTDFYGELILDRRLDEETLGVLEKMFTERHEEKSAPSYYCDLRVIRADKYDAIGWNGSEKTYELDKWIGIVCRDVLAPHGYVLNGELFASGEDKDDRWKIVVKDNAVSTFSGEVIYEDEREMHKKIIDSIRTILNDEEMCADAMISEIGELVNACEM